MSEVYQNSVYNAWAFNSWGQYGVIEIEPAPEGVLNSIAIDVRETLIDSGFEEEGLWSIFVGHEPNKPARSITIYDQEGLLTQSHNRTLWYYDRIQIRIRGLQYDETYAKMLSVQKFLILKKPFTLNGSAYKGFVTFGTPYYLGLNEQKQVNWSINFSVHREEITE